MISCLITSIIITIVTKKISAIDFERNAVSNENNFDKEPSTQTELEEYDEMQFNEIDTTTQNITSQDRMSYKQETTPFLPSHHHHHHHHPHSYYHHHHRHHSHYNPHHYYHHHHHPHHHRIPHYHKSRKKYRRTPKKSIPKTVLKENYMKFAYKQPTKPILLSEVLRNGGHIPSNILKPSGPYIEEDELEINPFSLGDTTVTAPGTFKFSKPPPSFEIIENSHDGFPSVTPVEEEIILPSITSMKPYADIRKPSNSIMMSLTKPSNIYVDDYPAENVRNVRLAKPQNSNVDKDIVNFLTQMKQQGQNLDSEPAPSEQESVINKGSNLNTAIAKLLLPFLSQSTVRQIQSYFDHLPKNTPELEEKNITNIVYIIENQSREFNKNYSNEIPYGTYSVTEPLRENTTNNTTYFIMVKSPNEKNFNATSISKVNSQKNQVNEQQKTQITPSSLQNLALQNYIMTLAGINQSPNNYLSRFKSYQKPQQNS